MLSKTPLGFVTAWLFYKKALIAFRLKDVHTFLCALYNW